MTILLLVLAGLVVFALVTGIIGAVVGDLNLWSLACLYSFPCIAVVVVLVILKKMFPGLAVQF